MYYVVLYVLFFSLHAGFANGAENSREMKEIEDKEAEQKQINKKRTEKETQEREWERQRIDREREDREFQERRWERERLDRERNRDRQ